jgi:cob(I)alamin adenosyltransferase
MTEGDVAGTGEVDYYTRSGDSGRTDFGAYGNLPKYDVRVAAYAECHEANAAVSMAIAGSGLPTHLISTLISVQNDLFDIAADLHVPLNSPEPAEARMVEEHVERLERAIDHFAPTAGDLSGMILPSGTMAAALLYQARAVVRRAERVVWAAVDQYPESINPVAGRYLNRLSALLFVLARAANAEHGDVVWVPEASVRPPVTGGGDAAPAEGD